MNLWSWIGIFLAIGAGSAVAGWWLRGQVCPVNFVNFPPDEEMPRVPEAPLPLWPHKVWRVETLMPESVWQWFSAMDETEMSKILYPMVKNLYLGRRTIHRCPKRKDKTINLFDMKGEK